LVEGIAETAHQVRELGLKNASDTAIFDFAKTNGYTIVTFDADFVDLSLVRGVPPKINWLCTRNLTTKSIAELLRKKSIAVQDFVLSADKEILELLSE
jgi:predicted nuclease of predicted toxin-antitoxin system